MEPLQKLYLQMIQYNAADPGSIQHFTKVHSYARLIGQAEGLSPDQLFTLETAALVHDIGIKAALTKYGHCTGQLQEQEGPPLAEKMLKELAFPPSVIARVCYLVGHHHTYTHVDGLDYRILLESDFLVNLYEGGSSKEAILSAYQSIFETQTGRAICQAMFGI